MHHRVITILSTVDNVAISVKTVLHFVDEVEFVEKFSNVGTAVLDDPDRVGEECLIDGQPAGEYLPPRQFVGLDARVVQGVRRVDVDVRHLLDEQHRITQAHTIYLMTRLTLL